MTALDQRKQEIRLANASGERSVLEPMAPAEDRHEETGPYGLELPAEPSPLGRAIS